jgi:hypothetical protein
MWHPAPIRFVSFVLWWLQCRIQGPGPCAQRSSRWPGRSETRRHYRDDRAWIVEHLGSDAEHQRCINGAR